MTPGVQLTTIGVYGPWAASLLPQGPGALSFRHPRWTNLEEWRTAARGRFLECVASPDTGGVPQVTVLKQYDYDGLSVEELTWKLPYGPPTEAVFLKPADATGPLPGILGLHCHGGNKYLGKRKITRTADAQHPIVADHHQRYYGGVAWANEIAKRGYGVLVHDAFAFASRRVLPEDVIEPVRGGLASGDPEDPDRIAAYNQWAAAHEHVLSKALFAAGATWPGVFLAEDQRALDVLCARPDVDATRVGCGGLSGGGLRTVMLGGADPRIRCAVCVGMMTTWRDYVLSKVWTHTWMCYVPLLPAELDYPEILGLRVPLPTLVLNDTEDQLFTLPEMQRADAMLAELFHKAGAADRYRCSYYPGPHKFDRAMQAEAFDWFDRWLK